MKKSDNYFELRKLIRLKAEKFTKMEGVRLRDRVGYISTGTTALDSLCGGDGAPLNSIMVIDEPITQKFARPLALCFLADALENGQVIFLASASPSSGRELFQDLPTRIPAETATGADDLPPPVRHRTDEEMDQQRMKIAWRYNTMAVVDSSISTAQSQRKNKVIEGLF